MIHRGCDTVHTGLATTDLPARPDACERRPSRRGRADHAPARTVHSPAAAPAARAELRPLARTRGGSAGGMKPAWGTASRQEPECDRGCVFRCAFCCSRGRAFYCAARQAAPVSVQVTMRFRCGVGPLTSPLRPLLPMFLGWREEGKAGRDGRRGRGRGSGVLSRLRVGRGRLAYATVATVSPGEEEDRQSRCGPSAAESSPMGEAGESLPDGRPPGRGGTWHGPGPPTDQRTGPASYS